MQSKHSKPHFHQDAINLSLAPRIDSVCTCMCAINGVYMVSSSVMTDHSLWNLSDRAHASHRRGMRITRDVSESHKMIKTTFDLKSGEGVSKALTCPELSLSADSSLLSLMAWKGENGVVTENGEKSAETKQRRLLLSCCCTKIELSEVVRTVLPCLCSSFSPRLKCKTTTLEFQHLYNCCVIHELFGMFSHLHLQYLALQTTTNRDS